MEKEENAEYAKKLRELERTIAKGAAWIVLTSIVTLIAADAIVVLVDAFFVRSDTFIRVAGAITGCFIAVSIVKKLRALHDRAREELKKISAK